MKFAGWLVVMSLTSACGVRADGADPDASTGADSADGIGPDAATGERAADGALPDASCGKTPTNVVLCPLASCYMCANQRSYNCWQVCMEGGCWSCHGGSWVKEAVDCDPFCDRDGG